MQPDGPIQRIAQANESMLKEQRLSERHIETVGAVNSVEEAVYKTVDSLVQFLAQYTGKTEVVNPTTSVSTPDYIYVVKSLNELSQIVLQKETDLSPIVAEISKAVELLQQIPKELPQLEVEKTEEVRVTNLDDLEALLKPLLEATKAIKVDVKAPVVNVPETKVNVEATDLKPTVKVLEQVLKAVKGIKFEVPKTDLSKLEKESKDQTKLLTEILDKPVGGGGGGGSTYIPLQQDGVATVAKALSERYDYDDSTTIYTAQAPLGTGDASTGWIITKYDLTDTNNASGKVATDVSWTGRAGGTYQ